MKKLITVVLVAMSAISMTFGGNCSIAPAKDTAWVYHWKFTGKTTKGIEGPRGISSACKVTPGAACAVRVPSSLKIQGYTMYCSPGCGVDSFETMLVEANEIFWTSKPYKSSFGGGITTEICNIIGKHKKQCEIGGVAGFNDVATGGTYSFTYAGLGKYDAKNSRIKSCSGNFAGSLTKPVYLDKKACSPVYAGCWDCGSLTLLCTEQPTVVYGKWSCKLKKTASKKYLSGRLPSIPKWAIPVNQQ